MIGFVAFCGVLSCFFETASASSDAISVTISTENTERHFHTRIVRRFAETMERRSGGRIRIRHVAEARLFRDRDAIRALQLGQLDMAVPGTWQLDRLVPDVGIFQLPLFYGRTPELIRTVTDGSIGAELATRIEAKLGVKVLGRWLDLGPAHIFGTGNPIRSYDDFTGRRIRIAGGHANEIRLRALGAEAFVIPWPDLPAALKQHGVEGVLTTFATIDSAKLWKLGVNSAFVDHQYFAHYVPLLSQSLWDRLPNPLKNIMTATWAELIDGGRELANQEQAAARWRFAESGGEISTPDPANVRETRQTMLRRQDDLVRVLGIDPELVERSRAIVESRR